MTATHFRGGDASTDALTRLRQWSPSGLAGSARGMAALSSVGPSLRRQSIVVILRELFALGAHEGKIARDHDTALLVHATIGTLSQFARALYFEDIAGPAVKRAPELERLILRIAW